jgi:hypothetical protein
MMMEAEREPKQKLSEKRCSDFDEDCEDVKCKISCWLGGVHQTPIGDFVTPPADGYCPYLRK